MRLFISGILSGAARYALVLTSPPGAGLSLYISAVLLSWSPPLNIQLLLSAAVRGPGLVI